MDLELNIEKREEYLECLREKGYEEMR